ncbi:MAG: hypothetical protein M1826_005161 [Phylliscum demangeonii]|nr:MAG: hypothetical protein M1826_005161 [Phylliscum demangeonii]
MLDGLDFKAAIEAEKKKAKEAYERRRSQALLESQATLPPPMASLPALAIQVPPGGIPGLGMAKPIVDTNDAVEDAPPSLSDSDDGHFRWDPPPISPMQESSTRHPPVTSPAHLTEGDSRFQWTPPPISPTQASGTHDPPSTSPTHLAEDDSQFRWDLSPIIPKQESRTRDPPAPSSINPTQEFSTRKRPARSSINLREELSTRKQLARTSINLREESSIRKEPAQSSISSTEESSTRKGPVLSSIKPAEKASTRKGPVQSSINVAEKSSMRKRPARSSDNLGEELTTRQRPAQPSISSTEVSSTLVPAAEKPYAGLSSARKRKRDESSSAAKNPSSARRPSLAGPESERSQMVKSQDRPFAPPKKPTRGPRPVFDTIQPIDTRTTARSSTWYDSIDMKQKYSRSDLNNLQYLRTLIQKCQKYADRPRELPALFGQMRQRLHQMEFYDFLSGVIVKMSKVLEDDVGLPQIFDGAGGVQYPWDVREDAERLYAKWMQGILDPHLLRGIESHRKQRTAGKSAMSHRLQKEYAGRVSCNVVGTNGLQNGQWWPMQICAMRDGAHGEIEAGIHGHDGRGAFSVILSSGGYDDRDDGDRIRYCGTSGSAGKPSAGTKHLIDSHERGQAVRVLRSAALPSANRYRPRKGVRYDGLYDIVAFEVVDVTTAMHRFELRRQAGQHPIRHDGVEARPTPEEILEYQKIRGLLGINAA